LHAHSKGVLGNVGEVQGLANPKISGILLEWASIIGMIVLYAACVSVLINWLSLLPLLLFLPLMGGSLRLEKLAVGEGTGRNGKFPNPGFPNTLVSLRSSVAFA